MEDKRRQMMNVSVTLAVIAAYGLVCLWVWNPKPLRWASPAPIDTLSVLGISLARWMKGLLWFAAVVYLALAAFAIYQALPAQREDLLQRRIGNLYIRACGINVGCVLIGAILNPGKVFCLPFFAHLILAPAVVIGLAVLVVIFAWRCWLSSLPGG